MDVAIDGNSMCKVAVSCCFYYRMDNVFAEVYRNIRHNIACMYIGHQCVYVGKTAPVSLSRTVLVQEVVNSKGDSQQILSHTPYIVCV
jgi:hypothetical protein